MFFFIIILLYFFYIFIKGSEFMLATKNLLKALSSEENLQESHYIDHKDDKNLGDVLTFCFGNNIPEHDIFCSDGTIRTFSFEE